jgi:hypothetical protein
MVKAASRQTRNEKLENLIMNQTLIYMSLFEEAFTALAEKMNEAMTEGAAVVADALGGKAKAPAKRKGGALPPAVKAEIGYLFSDMRQEMASQTPQDRGAFDRYVSRPEFDEGIAIVERYDFQRPKLTEKLTDEILASYVFLLQSGDGELRSMFKELNEWQRGLPKPPWAT